VFSQQTKNIELYEVVNTVKAIPKIIIDYKVYSMKNRNQELISILKSEFWIKSFSFKIKLQDFETKKEFSFKSLGRVRVFVNGNELTKRHSFKSRVNINKLINNIEYVEVFSEKENQKIIKHIKTEDSNEKKTFISHTEKVPVTLIKITASLESDFILNKVKNEIKFDQAKSIELEGVEVVSNIKEDGIVYIPKIIDGEITFEKSKKLTRLSRKSDRYLNMGLNKWGIDINARTWSRSLRAYLGAKETGTTQDGLPILSGNTSLLGLGGSRSSPLWVIDGNYFDFPPYNIVSFAPLIREVRVLKYGEAGSYGIRGSAGVIVINSLHTFSNMDITESDIKRSYVVKGKKNRKLMYKFQSNEKKYNQKIDFLKSQIEISRDNYYTNRADSLEKQLDNFIFRFYIYTSNFVLNNCENEIAPYLALTKISDIKISILDSIAVKLSPKVSKSKYGKLFLDFLESRKLLEGLK
jgi:hypothetical protein